MAVINLEDFEQLAPVFKGKAGNAVARTLMRWVKIQKINETDAAISEFKGAEFARATNEAVGVKYTVNGMPREEAIEHFKGILPEGPFITICNHPIGSLDGTSLIDFFGHIREDYKYMVNEVLTRFQSLRPSLIEVKPNGNTVATPSALNIAAIRNSKKHIEEGHPMGFFPSGAVSDLKAGKRPVVEVPAMGDFTAYTYKEPRVRDREWQMSVVKFIRNAGVPVVPVHCLDGNTKLFYRTGTYLGSGVRLALFPTQIFNKGGKTLRFRIGPIIPAETIAEASSAEDLRTFLRASVYSLE